MDLYRRTGTNPFSSCLPILIQSPFFFALFQLLNNLRAQAEGKAAGHRADHPRRSRADRELDDLRRPLSDSFVTSTTLNVQDPRGRAHRGHVGDDVHDAVPADAQEHAEPPLDNPFAKQQKVLLYLMPIFFAVSGINFPIGVLIYWTTTNLWTMGQQFYVIRNMPAPGSLAYQAMEERDRRKGRKTKHVTCPDWRRTRSPRWRHRSPASGSSPRARSARRARGGPGLRPVPREGRALQGGGRWGLPTRENSRSRKSPPPRRTAPSGCVSSYLAWRRFERGAPRHEPTQDVNTQPRILGYPQVVGTL